MSKQTTPLLLAALIAVLIPTQAFSQKTFPLSLGKEYLRSEITAAIGEPEKFGYDYAGGENDLNIFFYGKGVILNQTFTNLKLEWEDDDIGTYPVINYQDDQFTKRKAPLIGIALTDPTYRILEDKLPGGLYVGMQRSALKSIKGEHSDGRWGGIQENSYRIIFEDESMVLMHYNAWDRISSIVYFSPESGIFYWPKEDPYTPVDENDQLVSSYHGPDDLRGILVPSDPVDVFARFSTSNLEDNPAVPTGSTMVPLASLLDFDRQVIKDKVKDQILVTTFFRQDAWRGLKAVLHDSQDSINWNEATDINWYYLQESNGALLDDYIIVQFARKGFESGQRSYSFTPDESITRILVYADFQGNIPKVRFYHGGRIYNGRLLKRGEGLQSDDRAYRYVTVFKEIPQSKVLGIKRESKKEIIGTYRFAEKEYPWDNNRK